MSTSNNASLPKMICSVLGHRFKIQKRITVHTKEYKCECCGKEVTTTPNGNIIPLTDELKTIHKGLEQMVVRRSVKRRRPVKITA